MVSEALIDVLGATFPEKCIAEDESPEQAHRYAGKVELIRFLRMIYDSQRRRDEPE